ncbi:maleylpyruvate isomerase N-terminal domain-containing protein [Jiangella sp. DSM 45060]|uniref:maleylpyruvate isomerase N-terminal domain-containing protein n=1 Tax=Jiangella sp. DSM 45060 TaxID=1798224 RepID=UPI00087981D6|nr:maleylpyruvate isomerase N-terminal domain-containing protein [Jiangella sp. DSM 45060]SDS07388.1 Mycothiol maleylpyruvate isomerase N-terminal domain-containing protein [Jiangella sp. DSM 45060]
MTTVRQAYLDAAGAALKLLGDPAVAARWDESSALEAFTVGGLAGHLAGQVLAVPDVLAAPVPDDEPAALIHHYTRATWIGTGVDAATNVAIRAGGDANAADGPEALVERTAAALATLRAALSAEPAGRLVHLTGRWSLTLDDYLTTRLLEIAVHDDDLAVSVGVDTPELPDAALTPVFALLTALSARKHGAPAVLRALARAERAPSDITAI